MSFGPWDIMLVAGVSVHATILAYLYHPKWKTLVYSLPVPFTLASMSLGQPIGVTNVTGVLLLLFYAHGVRLLNQKAGVPIVASIALSAVGYCVFSAVLVRVLPQTDAAFWAVAAATWVLGLVLFLATPHREEPGHRTPLPVWIKLPVVSGVIVALVAMKSILQGFMTMFPMVGVIGAYETRYSQWAFSRQAPVIMLCMVPMMATCRLTHPHFGLGPSLLLGWVTLLALLVPLTWWMWASAERQRAAGAAQDARA